MITGVSGGQQVPTQRAISLEALRLHAGGLLASFERGHAGFVPDEYLAGLGRDTAEVVLELCLYGVWQRADGGYAVASSEALRMAHEVHREARRG
ncbi:MAG TPA: hypothetical protein VGH30_02000 [Jatrophihabitantaceae bacterium]|jgi:hypothetical protein